MNGVASDSAARPTPALTDSASSRESGALRLTYRDAVREAIRDALRADPRVFLMGEDVGRYGGCYAVSKGLLQEFGAERIRDTPLSEAAFVGAGIGAALGGMRPIIEVMTVNFSLLALDQVVNTAATMLHMSGGQFNVPIVIRMATGAGRQLAAQHSHSLENWYAHVPGLKVVAPATLEDARGMLASALADPDPVVIFEHVLLYAMEGELPAGAGAVPIEGAAVRRSGRDLTIIAYGGLLPRALAAAQQLAAEGVDAEEQPLPAAAATEEVMQPAAAPAPAAPHAPRRTPVLRGTGPGGAVTLEDVRAAAAVTASPPIPEEPKPVPPRAPGAPASPVARRMAEALGIDLASVHGSGSRGTIVRADVERAAATLQPPLAVPESLPPPPPETIPQTERAAAARQAIAATVTRSKREIPHYYLATHASMAPALAWLDRMNSGRSSQELLLPAVLQLRAVSLALRDFPEFNGFWIDGALRPADGVHLGVAVSLRGGGLVVPAIHHADRLDVDQLMRALSDVVSRARAGRLRGSEVTDATITVTNLGDRGVETVFGVIYPPQVALVGFGRVTERPWADGGMLGVRPVVTITLAADHRASDGHRGSLFLAAIARRLAEPERP